MFATVLMLHPFLLAPAWRIPRLDLAGDLKSANVFLCASDRVKIGDLGVARVLGTESYFARTCVGTPYYLSPELCEDKPYNDKSDVWALGCVLYELCTYRHPFDARNQGALILKIIQGRYPPVADTYSPALRALVDQLLQRDSRRRPTAVEILAEPAVLEQVQARGFPLPPAVAAVVAARMPVPPTVIPHAGVASSSAPPPDAGAAGVGSSSRDPGGAAPQQVLDIAYTGGGDATGDSSVPSDDGAQVAIDAKADADALELFDRLVGASGRLDAEANDVAPDETPPYMAYGEVAAPTASAAAQRFAADGMVTVVSRNKLTAALGGVPMATSPVQYADLGVAPQPRVQGDSAAPSQPVRQSKWGVDADAPVVLAKQPAPGSAAAARIVTAAALASRPRSVPAPVPSGAGGAGPLVGASQGQQPAGGGGGSGGGGVRLARGRSRDAAGVVRAKRVMPLSAEAQRAADAAAAAQAAVDQRRLLRVPTAPRPASRQVAVPAARGGPSPLVSPDVRNDEVLPTPPRPAAGAVAIMHAAEVAALPELPVNKAAGPEAALGLAGAAGSKPLNTGASGTRLLRIGSSSSAAGSWRGRDAAARPSVQLLKSATASTEAVQPPASMPTQPPMWASPDSSGERATDAQRTPVTATDSAVDVDFDDTNTVEVAHGSVADVAWAIAEEDSVNGANAPSTNRGRAAPDGNGSHPVDTDEAAYASEEFEHDEEGCGPDTGTVSPEHGDGGVSSGSGVVATVRRIERPHPAAAVACLAADRDDNSATWAPTSWRQPPLAGTSVPSNGDADAAVRAAVIDSLIYERQELLAQVQALRRRCEALIPSDVLAALDSAAAAGDGSGGGDGSAGGALLNVADSADEARAGAGAVVASGDGVGADAPAAAATESTLARSLEGLAPDAYFSVYKLEFCMSRLADVEGDLAAFGVQVPRV